METNIEQNQNIHPHKNKIHKILAHSYLFFFISFLLGLFLDSLFPLKIFEKSNIIFLGIVFLIFGTLLIFWAQFSSHHLKKENISKETFCCGPYRYTRTPTHFGLFILMVGFGILINSLFIIIFAIISFFLTKLIFIKKEEDILFDRYGDPYMEYKKSVKF